MATTDIRFRVDEKWKRCRIRAEILSFGSWEELAFFRSESLASLTSFSFQEYAIPWAALKLHPIPVAKRFEKVASTSSFDFSNLFFVVVVVASACSGRK